MIHPTVRQCGIDMGSRLTGQLSQLSLAEIPDRVVIALNSEEFGMIYLLMQE
jgi:hypothetical protein